jgi:hypothetical protein
MKRAAIAATLLLFACRGEQSEEPGKKTIASVAAAVNNDAAERSSLTNLAYGATIYARTGESLLETSAIATIDGEATSYWLNPAKDFPQSITVELPAPSRLDKVGIRAMDRMEYRAKELLLESSMDGRTFQPLATLPARKNAEPEWVAVGPVDAAFIRVTAAAPAVVDGNATISSILAHGRELAPAHPGPIDGCWTVNGRRTSFSTRGGRTVGTMQYPGHDTLYFDGAQDGRMWRFEWIRGPEFGYAAFSVSPDGKRLDGLQWHEEAIPFFLVDAWFGDHVECAGHAGALTAAAWPPHSTVADELAWLVEAIKKHPNARLVAHEYREANAQANRARAQRALDSLAKALQNAGIEPSRVTFVAAGSDNARQIPASEAARELYSTVDLEVGR